METINVIIGIERSGRTDEVLEHTVVDVFRDEEKAHKAGKDWETRRNEEHTEEGRNIKASYKIVKKTLK